MNEPDTKSVRLPLGLWRRVQQERIARNLPAAASVIALAMEDLCSKKTSRKSRRSGTRSN